MSQKKPHVVVGVVPGQPGAVVAQAATFAERFSANLVCASVDSTRYTIEGCPDGTVVTMPLNPDRFSDEQEAFDPGLREAIAETLRGRPVSWTVRMLAGGAAQELTRLADELDAAMIVVGTREAGLRGSLREFFNGSVAVQLAHGQHRPVVVIPLDPRPAGQAFPGNAVSE